MPTSDGISDRDWDRVCSLALLTVKASMLSNKKVGKTAKHRMLKCLRGLERKYGQLPLKKAGKTAKHRMLKCLRGLERKYGQLPSILATRADYVSGNREKERLFLRAYRLGLERKDIFNQTEISHSLAKLYIERCRRYQEGLKWLKILKAHIRGKKNEDLEEEHARLSSIARKGAVVRSREK